MHRGGVAVSPAERERLVAEAAGAYRARDAFGAVRSHPAWHDLDDEGRRESFALGRELRIIEAALDPEGLSSTARAVLARVRAGG